MRKKLFSACFILAAVLSLMTVSALAADVSSVEELQTAIDSAGNDEVINLSKSFSTENANIEVKDIEGKVKRTITINLEGTPRPYELVLGTGSIVVEGNNTLIIKGGTIVGSGNQVVEVKDGALDVQGTTVINDGSGIGVSITQTGGNLTMTDGIIQAKNGCAVYQSTFGTTTEIKGGTVTGAVGIVADAGWIFVGTENPGTPPTDPPIIEATGSGTRRVGNNQIRAAGIAFTQSVLSHITIYNGQVLSKNAEAIYSINAGSDAEIDIMGGTFSSDVSGSGFVPDAVAMLIHKDDSDADYTYYTYYTTLQDAITKAQTGDTVRLLKDAGTDSPVNISIDKAITLDLGTNTNSKTINGKLTIRDSNNDVAINGGAIKGGTIAISDAGVNITGSTITGDTSANSAVEISKGTVTISNTKITGTADGVSVTGGTLTVDGTTTTTTITGTTGAGITGGGVDTSITINGGTITGTTDGITFGGKELNLTGGNIKGTANGISATSGELNITNGTIEGTTNGVSVTGGTLNLTGGTIRGTGTATADASGIYIKTSSPDSTISGGTITGTTNGIKVELGTLTVKSGTINNSPNGIAVSGGTLNLTGGNITGSEYGISVTSGKVTVENATIMANGPTGVGIDVSDASELTVKSGTINANTGIIFSGDELTISEGTITANTTGIIFSDGKLTISGGTIMGSSEDGVKISSGTATISGGTITGMNGNGVSLTGGSLTVEGTTSSPMITGRSGAGIAVSGTSTSATVTGGNITGSKYGISVEYGNSTTVTIGEEGEENKNDNKDILISGGTALYIFEDPENAPASPATPEIKVYSGTFQSTSVISKTVDSSINGFIYGGKFINSTGSKDQIPPLYLAEDRTQKSDGTVVPIADGDIKVTFELDGGEFEDGSNSYELIVAAGDTFNKNDMPPDPIRDGHVFVGWLTDDGKEVPYGKKLTTDIKICAQWDQLLKFVFTTDGKGDFDGEEFPLPNEIIVEPEDSGVVKGGTLPRDKWPVDPIYNKGDEFVFGGWYTKEKGGTKVDYDTPFENNEELADLVSEDGTVTLYAHWGYKITFDLNYTGAPRVDYLVTEENEDGNHILTEWPKISEERTADWEFDGWFIGDECKAEEEPKDPDETKPLPETHPFEKHTTVHAHWTEKVDVTLTEPELKDKDDKEIKVLTSEEEEPKIILTVTGRNAKFLQSVDKSHFTLFMDGEEVSAQESSVDSVEIVPDSGDTKVVITLSQAPKNAGTLTIKVDGKAFPSPPKKDATVEIAVTYAVEFDPKGGTFADGSTSSQTLNTDITGTLTSLPADPELEGYGFVGWFIGDGSGECDNDDTICTKVVLGEESAVFTANTTSENKVHAHWKQLSFTIEFDPSPGRFVDGTETPVTRATSNSGYLGKAVFDELSNLIKADSNPNHTFDGWYTEQNGGGDEVTMDYQFDESTTVYAYWHKNPPYTITFDLDYDGSPSKTAEAKGKEGELTGKVDEADWPDETYTERTGYKFLGWYTKSTGEEGGEPVDKSYVFTNDTTLYAHWGYEITFNANGGTFGVEEKDDDGNEIIIMATDETFKLAEEDIDPPTSPEAGYVFGGWYTDPERGDPVDFGKPFKGKTTVYAHWDQSVALEADISELTAGGTVKEITLKITTEDVTFVSGVENDKSLFELSGAAAEGLSIESIVRSANGKEVKITLNKAPDVAGTLTITVKGAAFSPRNADKATVSITVRLPVYTITFDPNGGTLTGDTTAKTTDGKLSSLPTPTLDGYTFDGWYTAKEDGDKVTTDTVFTGDATIYAHWTKKTEDPGPGEPGKPDDPEPPEDDDRVYSVQIAFGSLHGRVSTDIMSAKKGTTVRISADPDSDYRVDSIRVTRDDTGATVSTGYTFAMPASNVTVTVKFSLRPEYNNFVPPQTQSQYQNQNQTQTGGAPATLPTSVFKPVTWRPAAALWDLPPTSWAYPAAQWAYQNGYLDTASDGTFRLNDTVSHMQLWRIMARWQGEAALDDNSVTQWARRTGASRIGTSSGAMTRQNIVEYLYQCYFLLGGNVSVSGNLAQYRDSQTIVSASAKNAWIWAVNKGIISGTPDGALNPNGILNRGEFASILMRLCQKG